MTDKIAKLTLPNGDVIELPMQSPTLGNDVIEISSLVKNGLFTYDPGFMSTAACESKITYIDGAKGILLYRGYPIDQLADDCDFMEVCYLLLNGELPNSEEKEKFVNRINNHTMVNEQLTYFFRGFRRDAHPMALMVGVVGALSAFYHDSLDINNVEHREKSAFRLLAKVPTIAAMCYRYSIGKPFVYPRNDMSYAENFLNQMFSMPSHDKKPNPIYSD